MKLLVRYDGSVKEMAVSKAMNVEDFRQLISDAFNVEPAYQRLIYSGKELADGNDLFDYKVVPGHTIMLTKRIVFAEINGSESSKSNKDEKSSTDFDNLMFSGEIDPDPDSGIGLPTPSSSLSSMPQPQASTSTEAMEEIRKLCPELALQMEQENASTANVPCKVCKNNDGRKCKECGCTVCGGKNDPNKQLFCEQCEYVTHMGCLNPPLMEIPEDDWYCPGCYVDKDEIIKVGEKVKLTSKTCKMPSRIAKENNKKIRDWGSGGGCAGRRKVCTKVHIHHVGPIPGVQVGMLWESRMQLSEEGIHRPPVAGIAGKGDLGAQSIVLSCGYEDDVDNGIEFFYTGAGGRDLSNNKRTGAPVANQTFTSVNLALARSCAAPLNGKNGATAKNWKNGMPIRVCRSYKAKKHSEFAPEQGYRYDGLYKVVKYWLHRSSVTNFMVYRYLLRRDDPSPAPWDKVAKKFDMILKDADMDKKRKADDDGSENNSGKAKKAKVEELFQLPESYKDVIAKDEKNKRLWDECLKFKCKTSLEFWNNLEDEFRCICCTALLHLPVTTECSHNICKGCLKKSLKSDYRNCPSCRKPFGEDLEVNEQCTEALQKLFPGYDVHRGSN